MATTNIDTSILRDCAEELFAEAIAQGMAAPFALDWSYWGRQYTDKLMERLEIKEEDE